MAQYSEHSIRPKRPGAALCFWIIQIFLGLPSLFQAVNLIVTGRAEGALFMIALFLAWIGATLAVATGSLIHGCATFLLPTTFGVFASPNPVTIPAGYEDTVQGFPYKRMRWGRVRALTAEGPVKFKSWEAFMDMVKEAAPRQPG